MLSYLILTITVYPHFIVFHFTQEKLNYFDWVSPEAYMTKIQVQLIYMGAKPRKHWQRVGNEMGNGRKPIKSAFSRQFPIWQLELSPAGQLIEHNSALAQPVGEETGICIYQLPIHLWVKLAPLHNNSRVIRTFFFVCWAYSQSQKEVFSPIVAGVHRVQRWTLRDNGWAAHSPFTKFNKVKWFINPKSYRWWRQGHEGNEALDCLVNSLLY